MAETPLTLAEVARQAWCEAHGSDPLYLHLPLDAASRRAWQRVADAVAAAVRREKGSTVEGFTEEERPASTETEPEHRQRVERERTKVAARRGLLERAILPGEPGYDDEGDRS